MLEIKYEVIAPDEVQERINKIPDASCDCDLCKEMCKLPCWGTPSEISKLIELGYANRLMMDYWVGNFTNREYCDGCESDTHIISPAEKGHEGGSASSWRDESNCTFQNNDRLCEIHFICKPVEGRKFSACAQKRAYGNNEGDPTKRLHEYVARLWDTNEGRKVVEQWSKLVDR